MARCKIHLRSVRLGAFRESGVPQISVLGSPEAPGPENVRTYSHLNVGILLLNLPGTWPWAPAFVYFWYRAPWCTMPVRCLSRCLRPSSRSPSPKHVHASASYAGRAGRRLSRKTPARSRLHAGARRAEPPSSSIPTGTRFAPSFCSPPPMITGCPHPYPRLWFPLGTRAQKVSATVIYALVLQIGFRFSLLCGSWNRFLPAKIR